MRCNAVAGEHLMIASHGYFDRAGCRILQHGRWTGGVLRIRMTGACLACKVDAGKEELLWVVVQQAGVDVDSLEEQYCCGGDFAGQPDQLAGLLDLAAVVSQQLSSLI